MSKNSPAKVTAYYGIMLGVCLVIGYLEAILPLDLGISGAKLGLTNFLIFFLLKRNGLTAALGINLVRILIINILFGSVFSLLYSLLGGICSTLLMYLLLKLPLGTLGISAAGGAMHNLAQTLCAAFMLKTPSVLKLLPLLLPIGMVAGIFCGILSHLLLSRMKKLRL